MKQKILLLTAFLFISPRFFAQNQNYNHELINLLSGNAKIISPLYPIRQNGLRPYNPEFFQ
jgi:hypothetical protein